MTSSRALVFAFQTLSFSVATLAAPSLGSAQACTSPACTVGELFPASGNVPANAITFWWDKPRDQSGVAPDSAATLQLLGAGDALTPVPVTNTRPPTSFLANMVPAQALAAGSELVFTYSRRCADEQTFVNSKVKVTASAPKPTSLGTLEVDVQRGTLTRSGGTACVATMDAAYADLSLTLANDALPYQDVIRYGLEVDGLPAESYVPGEATQQVPRAAGLGGSPLGRGKDRVYTACGGAVSSGLSGLTRGSHRVRLTGVLPDGSQLTSDEVEVSLRCDSLMDASIASPTTLDGGLEAGVVDDGGPQDAATTTTVAVGLDASLDAGGNTNTGSGVVWRHEGCSLAGAATGPNNALSYAGVLTALALWLRRRRARGAL